MIFEVKLEWRFFLITPKQEVDQKASGLRREFFALILK